MHWLLVGNPLRRRAELGMSIIVLTVMVRLLLFIPSRKQTQMNMRMMEVQKKLEAANSRSCTRSTRTISRRTTARRRG